MAKRTAAQRLDAAMALLRRMVALADKASELEGHAVTAALAHEAKELDEQLDALLDEARALVLAEDSRSH